MTTKTTNHPQRIDRVSKRQWVPITLMKVSPIAQREYRPVWARELAGDFDIEQLGIPVVSRRAGFFWIIDGQHRVGALKIIGYGDQHLECEVYEGLTEADEAEMFLRRNNKLTVTAYAAFKVAVVAGRTEEVAIDTIVRSCGLHVSKTRGNRATCAVGTLRRVYRRDGAENLRRALQIAAEAYGDAGLEADIINALGMMANRYGGALVDKAVVAKLSSALGGVNGLTNAAATLRNATGQPAAQCTAAAAVKLINRRPAIKGQAKLPEWWATTGGDE
ncbi:MAG TPA: DUF6551 family protein [Streptosporangiaceae bacterium]|nr:DUF6551 family protein [Streptosporangiaceae bacterium]